MSSFPVDFYQTERLTVADWGAWLADPKSRAELQTALEAILTPRVTSHLPPSMQIGGSGGVASWIDARAAESTVFVIKDTGDRRVLGLLFLAELASEHGAPDIHLGYLLSERCWGHGVATEVVSGLVDALAMSGHSYRLLGGVGVDNPASARVLVKAGFLRDAALSTDDTDIFTRSVP